MTRDKFVQARRKKDKCHLVKPDAPDIVYWHDSLNLLALEA